MESRKMVLINLFAGQQWRNRHREQTYGQGERGEEGEMYGKSASAISGRIITNIRLRPNQQEQRYHNIFSMVLENCQVFHKHERLHNK